MDTAHTIQIDNACDSAVGFSPPVENPDDEEMIRKGEKLIAASRRKDHEQAKHLLQEGEVNVNYKDEKGNTAFHIAAKNEDKTLLELLLDHPDVDIHTGLYLISFNFDL